MHRSEIRPSEFCPEAGLRASNETKGDINPMKKLIRDVVEYFGKYGHLINEWNRL